MENVCDHRVVQRPSKNRFLRFAAQHISRHSRTLLYYNHRHGYNSYRRGIMTVCFINHVTRVPYPRRSRPSRSRVRYRNDVVTRGVLSGDTLRMRLPLKEKKTDTCKK
jgi:hypothetical protein